MLVVLFLFEGLYIHVQFFDSCSVLHLKSALSTLKLHFADMKVQALISNRSDHKSKQRFHS
uniref:Uncharacterized protein n=1 Tax=Helianthus annuus TaxID=4232 RepID=A0A251SC88_HELAN